MCAWPQGTPCTHPCGSDTALTARRSAGVARAFCHGPCNPADVSQVECVLYRMCSLQNVFSIVCVIYSITHTYIHKRIHTNTARERTGRETSPDALCARGDLERAAHLRRSASAPYHPLQPSYHRRSHHALCALMSTPKPSAYALFLSPVPKPSA